MADGSFLEGCPVAAFWGASVYRAPYLCVIYNNEGYNALKRNLRVLYGENGFWEKMAAEVGLDIVSPPDYALIAQAAHGYGRMVTDPAEIKPALREALDQVRSGKLAVVDVRIGTL